jgi:phospho-N-acetylmuramoyl-pentapeptide-transferase
MGGLYFLAGITLVRSWWRSPDKAVPCCAGGHARLRRPGAYDDLRGLRDREGVGWLAGPKFPVQWGLALCWLLWPIGWPHAGRGTALLGPIVGIGLWFIPVAAFLLVAFPNAVNLSDGLDGLRAAYRHRLWRCGILVALDGQRDLALFCMAVSGALLAFLWFNVRPARMFMGDVGSEALGAGLAMVMLCSGHWLLLPVVGIVFVAEALSVMLQVSYFKYTRKKYGEGRRIFRMAPLHHHFEVGGQDETQVTARFWIAGALRALLTLAMGASEMALDPARLAGFTGTVVGAAREGTALVRYLCGPGRSVDPERRQAGRGAGRRPGGYRRVDVRLALGENPPDLLDRGRALCQPGRAAHGAHHSPGAGAGLAH